MEGQQAKWCRTVVYRNDIVIISRESYERESEKSGEGVASALHDATSALYQKKVVCSKLKYYIYKYHPMVRGDNVFYGRIQSVVRVMYTSPPFLKATGFSFFWKIGNAPYKNRPIRP